MAPTLAVKKAGGAADAVTKSTKTARKRKTSVASAKLESEDGRAVRRSGRGGSKRPKEDVKFVSERAGPAEYYEVVDEKEAFEATRDPTRARTNEETRRGETTARHARTKAKNAWTKVETAIRAVSL